MTSRTHGLVISLALGTASAVAAYAVIVTGNVAEGTTRPEVATDHAIAVRARKLDAWEASLRKALAARPPAVPARARYTSVVLMSPPGALVLPTPATAPPRPAGTMVSATVSGTAPTTSHTKRTRTPQPKASPSSAPRGEDDDEDDSKDPAPVQVAAPQPAPVAAAAPTEAAPTVQTPPAAPVSAPSAEKAAEQQCRTILRAAENQGEKATHAAEAQCEALKQAAEGDH